MSGAVRLTRRGRIVVNAATWAVAFLSIVLLGVVGTIALASWLTSGMVTAP